MEYSSPSDNNSPGNKPLILATDCAGVETPIKALEKIERNFIHQSSSESCPQARKSIWANHKPIHLCHDLTARDNSKMPRVDLYIAGFPCQPFSSAGLKLGFDDPKNGHIFKGIADYVNATLPTVFIVEIVH